VTWWQSVLQVLGGSVVLFAVAFALMCAGDWLVYHLQEGIISVGHWGILTERGAASMRDGHPAVRAVWADYRKVHIGPLWLVAGRRRKVQQ
jgi:hypothetical protein